MMITSSSLASHSSRFSYLTIILAVMLTLLSILLVPNSKAFMADGFRSKWNKVSNETETIPNANAKSQPGHLETVTSRQCSSVLNYIHSGETILPTSTTGTGKTSSRFISTPSSIKEPGLEGNTLVNAVLPSIQSVWHDTVHPKLLTQALRFATLKLGTNRTVLDLNKMKLDFARVHNEFIVPRLRKSLIRSMEGDQVQRMMQIIEKRLMDPENNPRLEIMVFGGSVVQGWHSEFHNWFQPGFENKVVSDSASYSWPARLQAILNNVLFRGRDVVRVTNMALGGTTSDVGAVSLEYRRFPPNYPGPDIIIHSYGINDGRVKGEDIDRLNIMQEFIHAARAMHCDTDKLPSIILYDDFMSVYFHDIHYAMRYSQSVSKVSAWYELMAVSYANAFRHTVYSGEGFGNETAGEHELGGDLPMIGWRLEKHPGMLYHSTSPWTLVYNLLDNMINTCQDHAIMMKYKPSYQELPLQQIPELTKEFMLSDLSRKWKENVVNHQQACQKASGRVCAPTSWIVGPFAGGARKRQDINDQMRKLFLSDNAGWHLESEVNKKPRPGWVAFTKDATFTVTIKEHEGIGSLTVVSMLSYSANWVGSLVRITVFDRGPSGEGPNSSAGLFEISGYHNTTTSVLHPHKFRLLEDGIPKGNWLSARFDLVGGSTFRIQGLLFCTS